MPTSLASYLSVKFTPIYLLRTQEDRDRDLETRLPSTERDKGGGVKCLKQPL